MFFSNLANFKKGQDYYPEYSDPNISETSGHDKISPLLSLEKSKPRNSRPLKTLSFK